MHVFHQFNEMCRRLENDEFLHQTDEFFFLCSIPTIYKNETPCVSPAKTRELLDRFE